jgi:1,2-diacylglycerol 3-beta-galactosyltransferase
MFQALRRVNPPAPYVTIITDFADCPPNFWVERQNQYVVCPTAHAVGQACELGVAERFILRTSGVIPAAGVADGADPIWGRRLGGDGTDCAAAGPVEAGCAIDRDVWAEPALRMRCGLCEREYRFM